jgi:hypothetical protein
VQDPPKFTQIWIFGLNTNDLATRDERRLFERGKLFPSEAV